MIYLICGEEQFQIKKQIASIIKEDNGFNVHSYNGDGPSFNLNNFLDDCLSLPLFAEKNYAILRNPPFLTGKKEGLSEYDEKRILDYIANPPFENDMILYTEGKEFVKTSKLYKQFVANAQLIEFKLLDYKDFKLECRRILKSHNIIMDDFACDILINACKGKLENLYQYIDLLKLYPDQIDSKVVKTFVGRVIEDDNFKMINAITDKNVNFAIQYLNDLFTVNESPLALIASLASQFRYLYQVKYLNWHKYTFDDIKAITKTNKDFRLKVAIKTVSKFSELELLSILNELATLDSQCKSDDSIESVNRLELFIIKLARGKYAIN